MESIKNIFRIGRGPSSSHTMAPRRAAMMFAEKHPQAPKFRVSLYGSLAATGTGHMTDVAILDILSPIAPTEIRWNPKVFLPEHPNGMTFEVVNEHDEVADSWTVFSTGGGALSCDENKEVYDMNTIHDILAWCDRTGRAFWEYVEICEGADIWDYLKEVWATMQDAIHRGLANEGVLPGGLGVRRKACDYLTRAQGYSGSLKNRGHIYAYALACSEENAAGGIIVTAPTCGSCGVLPSALYHLKKSREFPESRLIRAIATAGLFGNVVKRNASISGAEVGCQGEVGVACAMAAAATCQVFGGTIFQIEYAAEMGLEHHLGLTCDPVCGLVQIPCIERNAFAATRAFDANTYAMFTDGHHRVDFDKAVRVMRETGKDLPSLYKETSEGGLAKRYND